MASTYSGVITLRPLPTLLLLPGLDGTGRLFDRFIAAVGRRPVARVSYPTDERLGYQALIDRVVRSLPTGRVVLVGESFSGPIALGVAARKPTKIAGVVLVASFVRSPFAGALGTLARAFAPLLMRSTPPSFAVRRFLVGRGAERALVRDVRASLTSTRASVRAHRLRTVLDADATADLARCRCPILALLGKRDALIPPIVASSFGVTDDRIQVETIDGPHMLMLRCPDACARTIERFVERRCR